jgi:predicted PurR-regulated permease PerM
MRTPQDAAIARLQPARDRSRAEWALLRARLSTITPQAVGRGILSVVVLVIAGQLAIATWPSLLPFAIGGLLAYTIYPLVDLLGQVMPRVLAAALALILGLVALGLVVAVVVPPLVSASIQFLQGVPDSAQLAQLRNQVDAYLATLPEGARTLVTGILERIAAIAAGGLSSFLDSVAGLIVAGVVGIFDTIGFVIGLVLLPLWVLSVVRDGRSLRGQVAAQFAPGLRDDAMALLTIVHRALSTFLRVQIAAAAAAGVGIYTGLYLVQRAGMATYAVPVAVAAFMGAAQVIPQLGGLIGAVPIVLIALGRQDQPEAAVALLVVYLVVLQVVKLTVGGRLGRDLNVRPALALPAFAIISQVGLVWLLFSAPLLVIARNTVRYLRGRLAEPPAPAGVLSWERRRTAGRSASSPAPVPSIYRDRGPAPVPVRPAPTAISGRPGVPTGMRPAPGGEAP